jgi:predicted transcriptional regulator of viral defense system
VTIQKLLWETAVDQYGYVTTQDAHALGISVVELAKLAHRGQLTRVAHGAYRFDRLPPTDRDEYALAVLWTGVQGAALAHDTALAVYGLCDINPRKIHVVVPVKNRIRRTGGSKYVIHHEDLIEDQLGWWAGIRTVMPAVAIAQGIRSGVPAQLIDQAIKTAEARGFIRKADRIRFGDALKARR